MKTDLALSLIFILVAVVMVAKLANHIQKDYRLYQAEGECVGKLVAKGYERNQIKTSNGTCWVGE